MQSIATQKHKTLRNKCFVFLFVLVSVFSVSHFTYASTIISGTQTTDLSLTTENSPYIVEGILEMNPGRTLHIDPGVIIKFQDENSGIILNNAILDANGTETEKIHFTSIKDDSIGGDTNGDGNITTSSKGDWKYIYFAGTSFPNNLSHIVVRYAGATNVPAIWHYFSSGSLSITDSSITNNLDTGLTSRNSTATITNSEILNNTNYGVFTNGSLVATSNYWGDPTGPTHATNPTGLGDKVSDGVTFDPWLGIWPPVPPETVCIVDCFSNVLFLPGIQGSRLYDLRENGTEDQLWEPNGNSDVEDLYLNSDGTSVNQGVYTRDMIKKTNISPYSILDQKIYESFSDKMDQLVIDHKINEWQPFAYDWRQDINDSANTGNPYPEGVRRLRDMVTVLSNGSKTKKVTIVTHSTGGIVAKALLQKLQEEKEAGASDLIDKVDVVILVAVPQIGTPDTLSSLLHGIELKKGLLMDRTRSRLFSRNMLGAYGLLPSREYLNRIDIAPIVFEDTVIPSGVTTQFIQSYGNSIDSYAEYKSFLFGDEGRVEPGPSEVNLPIKLSSVLFGRTEILHDNIDNWVPPTSLRVIEVAGWGTDTVAGVKYYPKYVCVNALSGGPTCRYVLDEKPIFTVNGDKTVVVPSAHYMSFSNNAEKYWLSLKSFNEENNLNISHKDIFEAIPVIDFVVKVIQGQNLINTNNFSVLAPVDNSNRLRLSIHSPVTIDAYDTKGNHTGRICSDQSDFCYIEENIPNSSYIEFGEGKYINLPEDQFSKIKLQGTDIGTFTYESEKFSSNGVGVVSSFIDIPVTTQTQAEIVMNDNTQTLELKIDIGGDGLMDFTILPSDTFDPILYLQIMKETINSFDLAQYKKKELSKKIDNVIKLIQKGKINKAELRAEKFKSRLEHRIIKLDSKHPKPRKLSKTEAQILLDMLNKLLDNLK